MSILSVADSCDAAVDFFGVFSGKRPRLIPLGIPAIDKAIGGLGPGAVGILAGSTGLGKSSVMLEAALTSSAKTGILSFEDPPDVLGSRIIGRLANINAMHLRTGAISPDDRIYIKDAIAEARDRDDVRIAYLIGQGMKQLEDAMDDFAFHGIEMVWLDYVQKIRGVSNDRRSEVGTVFTEFQRMASERGMAAMAVSQLARGDHTKPPSRHSIKESGDLENEARLIVLGHRNPKWVNIINWRLDKSTFGGEGIEFSYRRDERGVLKPMTSEEWERSR